METVQKDSENYKKEILLAKINKIKSQIDVEKQKIYTLYTNESDFDEVFCDNFIKVKCENGNIVIIIDFPDHESYGLKFEKCETGVYALGECVLPFSFDIYSERKIASALTLEDIPTYITKVEQNIYNFMSKETQFKKLEESLDRNILLYHSLDFTEISMKVNVLHKGSNKRILTIIEFTYEIMECLPRCIEIKTKNKEIQTELKKHFEIFLKKYLDVAYNLVFKESEISSIL